MPPPLDRDDRRDAAGATPARPDSLPEWSSLLGRAVDDLARIAQAEIRLLGVHLAASLEAALQSALATVMVAAAMLCAEVCLVAALILLLHHWMQWWMAAAAAGGSMLITALLLQLTIRGGRTSSR